MMKDDNDKKIILPYLLGISGITFWFILGFPFAERNEAYSWITKFEQSSFINLLTKTFPTIITYRPISQTVSWLLYRLGNNEIYLIQILNYLLLILALWYLIKTVKEKYLLSVLLFLCGLLFITGYYYIFQLQGIFYSPMILYAATLYNKRDLLLNTNKNIILLVIWTLVVTGIHTYSIIIFQFFLIALILINKKNWTKRNLFLLLIASLCTIAIIIFNSGSSSSLSFGNALENLKNSFFSLELSGKISPLILLITFLTIFLINDKKIRYLLIIFSCITYYILYVNNLPVLFLLSSIIIIKSILKREWILLSIISSMLLFPSIVESGAPTKSIMLLTFLIFGTSIGLTKFESVLLKQKNVLYGSILSVLLIMAILTRLNINVPILNKFTLTFKQEREKTFQLKKIINWYLLSDYKECYLSLESDPIPLNKKNLNLERRNIAPTNQGYLDEYILYKKKISSIPNKDYKLVITFGDEVIADRKIIYQSYSKHAGYARLYY